MTRPRLASISTLSQNHNKYAHEMHDFIGQGQFYIQGRLAYLPLSMTQRVFVH